MWVASVLIPDGDHIFEMEVGDFTFEVEAPRQTSPVAFSRGDPRLPARFSL